jgi:hypothetical protein
MRKTHWFYFPILCLLFSLFSCEEKDDSEDVKNAIAGTWQLTSMQIDGTATDLSSSPDVIQFQSNAIFQSYNTITQVKVRGGWSYEGDMLNISVYLPAAYYVLKADAQNLSLKRLDFNTEGTLTTTLQEYRRSPDSEMP